MKVNKRTIFIVGGIVIISLIAILYLFYKNSNEKWILDGTTVIKGDKKFQIGELYEYDETNNGEIENLTNTNWKVLGVSDSGNLLIVSTTNVEEIKFGDKDNIEISQSDYINGIDKLNDLAKMYGQGKNAVNARSIKIEDINKITNYNPENFGLNFSYEYNNMVTYYWYNEANPVYEGTNGANGTLTSKHEIGFIWYDEETKKWNNSGKPIHNAIVKPIEKEKIATLKNNWYAYDNEKFDKESLIYQMLFLDSNGNNANYWLANQFIYTANMFVGYGYQLVNGDSINYRYLLYSQGTSREYTAGLRVVVELK